MRRGKSYVFVLLAAFIWGTIGIFVKTLRTAGFTEGQLIAFRAWVSVVIMVIWLFFTDRKQLRIRLRDVWLFVGTGIISFLLFSYCYFISLQLTSLSTAAILLYTSPIFVTVLSTWLFKERFTKRKAAALVMAFGGCCLVCGFSASANPLGIVLGILSGFFYALYSIFGKVALRRYSSLTVTTYTFVFASIGIIPFCGLDALGSINWTPLTTATLIFFAAASGAAAYLFYTLGLAGLPATDAAVVAILEPVVAALAGVIVYHEQLGFPAIAGICLVIGAILVLSLGPANAARGPSQSPNRILR